MTRPFLLRGSVLAVSLGLASIGGIAAFAVAGWAEHGEAIFLKLADGAWLTCF